MYLSNAQKVLTTDHGPRTTDRRPVMPWHIALLVVVPALLVGTTAQAQQPVDFAPELEPIDSPSLTTINDSIDRGIAFLLESQKENGSWGSATRTKGLNIYAPIPGAHHGFKTAVTAMVIASLYETGGNREDVRAALDEAEAWLLEHLPEVRRATGDAMYNVWTHCYAIQALLRMRSHRPDDDDRQETINELIQLQFDRLETYASVDGGWGTTTFAIRPSSPRAIPSRLSMPPSWLPSTRRRRPATSHRRRSSTRRSPPPSGSSCPTSATCTGSTSNGGRGGGSIVPAAVSDDRRPAIWRCGCGATRRSPTTFSRSGSTG